MSPVLELCDVSCSYAGVPAVRSVSLTIERGEVLALLGPNGSGKTTIVKAIADLLEEREGDIRFDGDDLPSRRQAHQLLSRGMAIVPDHRALFPRLTVEQHLRLVTTRSQRGRIDEIYDVLPKLSGVRQRPAGLLSGGEAQMLAVGRALVTHPKLLVVDELSFGLAPKIVDVLLELIRARADDGLAVLLVEQHVDRALDVADRAHVLARGRTVDEVVVTPGSSLAADLAAKYLGSSFPAETAPADPSTADVVHPSTTAASNGRTPPLSSERNSS